MQGKIKRISIFVAIAVLAAVLLTACGGSEFGLSENTGKRMTITAERTGKDAFFLAGSLEVSKGEQIVITSGLKKGSIRVELVREADKQSIGELPDIVDGEAAFKAEVSGTDTASGTVPAGSYMLRATGIKKATGTVQIEVKPAS